MNHEHKKVFLFFIVFKKSIHVLGCRKLQEKSTPNLAMRKSRIVYKPVLLELVRAKTTRK